MSKAIKAAVIGASGIGKHHAKWLAKLGCDVCAIVGSSAETAQAAADGLREMFGFSGAAYSDIGHMLEEQKPDLVNICTPPALHHTHVLKAAPHVRHVLCEKPLTWDEDKPLDQLLEEAQEITTACTGNGRIAAVNLQYAAAPAAYRALCSRLGIDTGAPQRFFMHMDSKPESNKYEIIWRELAPHCLSVMVAFCGPGTLATDSISLEISYQQCRACFIYQPVQGAAVECEIITGNVPEGPLTRRFGINDYLADYTGRNNADGVFATYLSMQGDEAESDDFMYLSMAGLVAAVRGETGRPLVTMTEGLDNQRMQIEILKRGRRV